MDVSTQSARTETGFSIRLARSPSELEQVFKFRYRIYVEEMHRKQKHADHVRKEIRDPLDDFAANFSAWDATGKLVGVLRTNRAKAGDLGAYECFYEMNAACSAHPDRTSITTRLMILPECRGSSLAIEMAVSAYDHGLEQGVTHNFIDCNDYLVPFFKGLGFVQYLPKKYHEEYGAVTCMRLNVFDREHLERISSPFLPSLIRWQTSGRQRAPIFATLAPV